jgi:mannose-6-phosphate isomerase
MVNPVKHYAWGSRDGIATLQGRPPADRPEAELWMGAHPQASSALEGFGDRQRPLNELIAADPHGVLGVAVVDRFGPRLPFMAKLIAAAEPLSLQAHPDDALAAGGFAREDAAGIDRAADHRVYRDPHGKPEILLATSHFHALLGFRPASDAAAALKQLHVALLQPVIDVLERGRPTGEAFGCLIQWPEADRAGYVATVAAAARHSPQPHARWIVDLASRYPTDLAVVGVLLLNHVELRPGQVVSIPPGQIHAYLSGIGVEVLGGSDNVVRAGLTPKHVDLAELRRILHLDAAVPAFLAPVDAGDGWQQWPTPYDEFRLSRLELSGEPVRTDADTAAVLCCLSGSVEIAAGATSVRLAPGESAFLTADAAAPALLAGNGVVVRVSAGVRA